MSDRNILDLDARLQPLALEFIQTCKNANIRVGLSQTYRSSSEQDADYAQGRTIPGKIITNAKGGQSAHNCTLSDGTPSAKAFDFFVLDADDNECDWNADDAQWQKAISIGKNLGLVSGDTFDIKDYAHMELPGWQTT